VEREGGWWGGKCCCPFFKVLDVVAARENTFKWRVKKNPRTPHNEKCLQKVKAKPLGGHKKPNGFVKTGRFDDQSKKENQSNK